MAYPQIAAFARLADGSVAPTRSIAGQATKIGRASHDVTYDPVNDEIVVASANAQAVITLPGGANGDTPPLRVIQGPHTQLQSPGYGAAIDWVNNELFVVEGRDRPGEEYILVFPRTAKGDVAPLRKIQGPDTLLKNARNIVVDPVRNLIAISSRNGTLIFNRTDSGNAKPRAIIKGIGGKFRLIQSKGWIVGAPPMTHQRRHRSSKLLFSRRSLRRAKRETPIKDEVGHSFWVSHSIDDRYGTAL